MTKGFINSHSFPRIFPVWEEERARKKTEEEEEEDEDEDDEEEEEEEEEEEDEDEEEEARGKAAVLQKQPPGRLLPSSNRLALSTTEKTAATHFPPLTLKAYNFQNAFVSHNHCVFARVDDNSPFEPYEKQEEDLENYEPTFIPMENDLGELAKRLSTLSPYYTYLEFCLFGGNLWLASLARLAIALLHFDRK
ncbi:hypothetical protein M0802_001403 [Mischocyttarus mexicanus]|nr:hypothetical protein M0802_001403 [Mischocyttarus mexicanus]